MMISRQRERISSNLTSLIREHNKMSAAAAAAGGGSGSASSNSSSDAVGGSSGASRCEKLLGLPSCNVSGLFDFESGCEFGEEDVWAIADQELNPTPILEDAAQLRQQPSKFAESSNRFFYWLSSSSASASSSAGSSTGSSNWVESNTASRMQAPLSSRIQSSSKPQNVPDWSKILRSPKGRGSRSRSRSGATFGEEEEEFSDGDKENQSEEEEWIPPHALAARQDRIRASSMVAFSVLEGAGRTLKGRDLSRVRNAVWRQTGYMAV